MADIKYVDYKGLKLYHLLNKKYTDKHDGLITVLDDPIVEDNVSKHTLLITDGVADLNGTVTSGRKVKVNIDNDSIVFKLVPDELYTAEDLEALEDESLIGTPKTYTYKLGVNDNALIPYKGGDGINVTSETENGLPVNSISVALGDTGLKLENSNGKVKLKTGLKITKLASGNVNIGPNDRAVYALTDSNGNTAGLPSGDFIRIPKDSSLKNVEYVSTKPAVYYTQEEIDEAQEGDPAYNKTINDIAEPAKNGQFLKFTYITIDDSVESEKVVYVDMSNLITEAEYGAGLDTEGEANSKKLIVKIDPTSETRNWTLTELDTYNSLLEGFVTTSDLNEETGENYTLEEANLHNSELEGFKTSNTESFLTVSNNGLKLSGINKEIIKLMSSAGTITADASKYFSSIKIENGSLVGTQSPLPSIALITNNLPNLSRVRVESVSGDKVYNISNIVSIQSVSGARDTVYYTLEEADAYNTEHELVSDDADYKTTESVKTQPIDGLATALDVKTYVDETVTIGTSHVSYYLAENNDLQNIAGLFSGDLTLTEILAVITTVFPQ